MIEDSLDFITVQKCVLSGSNLKFVDWESLISTIKSYKDPEKAQEEILKATVLHPCNVHYPVKEEYQRNFLKKLINQLENSGEEVCESLYKEYLGKLKSAETQQYHFRHFQIHKLVLTIQENLSFISDGTTGLATWEGGLALAEWCVQNSPLLRSRRVLELGCGLGLTGLTASLCCCPLSYTFTDHHPSVLRAVDHNWQLNRHLITDTEVKTELLDWESAETWDTDVDVVLAADVVFDDRLFPGLVNTLFHFLSNKATFAVLACTERNPQTLSTFLTCLDQKDIKVEELTCPEPKTFFYSLSPPIRFFQCSHGE